MKRPNALLKVAAVASAVLLVGALVSYRAGAFRRLLASPAAAEPPPAAGEADPELLPSSKSW